MFSIPVYRIWENESIILLMGCAMKLSRYNWTLRHNESLIVANGFTGAIAVVEPQNEDYVSLILDSKNNIDNMLASAQDSVLKDLVAGGFLIEDSFDERQYLQHVYEVSKHRGSAGLTIVPTLRCNFGCPYCYENGGIDDSDDMSEEVMERIVQHAKESEGDKYSIAITGGEPTLTFSKLVRLLQQLKNVVEARNSSFIARIITNGYLLDRSMAQALSQLNVKSAQITLDGNREQHNSRRRLKTGEATFDVIVENIKAAADYFSHIKVRVNIESSEHEQYKFVSDLFKSYSNINVYQSPTRYGDNEPNRTRQNAELFWDHRNTETEELIKYTGQVLPVCTAVKPNNPIVLPDGSLTKCWEQIAGPQRGTYASLVSADTSNYHNYLPWVLYNPYIDSSVCYNCKLLPNCAARCPASSILENKGQCSQNEFANNFTEYIKTIYDRLTQKGEEDEVHSPA
jgi:uncharacterized protein